MKLKKLIILGLCQSNISDVADKTTVVLQCYYVIMVHFVHRVLIKALFEEDFPFELKWSS